MQVPDHVAPVEAIAEDSQRGISLGAEVETWQHGFSVLQLTWSCCPRRSIKRAMGSGNIEELFNVPIPMRTYSPPRVQGLRPAKASLSAEGHPSRRRFNDSPAARNGMSAPVDSLASGTGPSASRHLHLSRRRCWLSALPALHEPRRPPAGWASRTSEPRVPRERLSCLVLAALVCLQNAAAAAAAASHWGRGSFDQLSFLHQPGRATGAWMTDDHLRGGSSTNIDSLWSGQRSEESQSWSRGPPSGQHRRLTVDLN